MPADSVWVVTAPDLAAFARPEFCGGQVSDAICASGIFIAIESADILGVERHSYVLGIYPGLGTVEEDIVANIAKTL